MWFVILTCPQGKRYAFFHIYPTCSFNFSDPKINRFDFNRKSKSWIRNILRTSSRHVCFLTQLEQHSSSQNLSVVRIANLNGKKIVVFRRKVRVSKLFLERRHFQTEITLFYYSLDLSYFLFHRTKLIGRVIKEISSGKESRLLSLPAARDPSDQVNKWHFSAAHAE